jgi:AbiV family abortive infection protein
MPEAPWGEGRGFEDLHPRPAESASPLDAALPLLKATWAFEAEGVQEGIVSSRPTLRAMIDFIARFGRNRMEAAVDTLATAEPGDNPATLMRTEQRGGRSSRGSDVRDYSSPMDVLKLYRGRLTPTQAADGINCANVNAKRLADDAESLFERGSFATAASLAILAIEETGKVSIIRSILTAEGEDELREEWKRYRRHTEKNQALLVFDLFNAGARKLSDFAAIFHDETESARRTFDVVKQLGFYTDCCGDKGRWAAPTEVVDRDFASLLLRMAQAVTKGKRSVSTREMELWAQHMKGGATEAKLLAWCAAAEAEGLHPEGYGAEMHQFVMRGIHPPSKPH